MGTALRTAPLQGGAFEGLNPLLHDKSPLLLLLLESEREEIQQEQARRLFVRMPRVVLE